MGDGLGLTPEERLDELQRLFDEMADRWKAAEQRAEKAEENSRFHLSRAMIAEKALAEARAEIERLKGGILRQPS